MSHGSSVTQSLAVRLSFVLLITRSSEAAVNNRTVFILIALCGAFERCVTRRGIQRGVSGVVADMGTVWSSDS